MIKVASKSVIEHYKVNERFFFSNSFGYFVVSETSLQRPAAAVAFDTVVAAVVAVFVINETSTCCQPIVCNKGAVSVENFMVTLTSKHEFLHIILHKARFQN